MNELMTQISFDFDQQLEQHAVNIERVQREAVFDIGRELAAAQELWRYNKAEGGFTGWLAARLPHIPQSSAYQAIDIYKGIDPVMFPNFGNMKPGAILEVAKAAPDVQALIAEKVEAGEIFTAAQVKQFRADAAEAEADRARQDISELKAKLAEKDRTAEALVGQIAALKELGPEKDAEIDRLKRELDDIANDPVMQAMREAVEQAAANPPAPKGGKANPIYEPNPSADETLKIVGPCRMLAARIRSIKVPKVLAGFIDDGDRTDGLNAIRECRDFFTLILEEANDN